MNINASLTARQQVDALVRRAFASPRLDDESRLAPCASTGPVAARGAGSAAGDAEGTPSDGALWSQACAPHCAKDVLGNDSVVQELVRWLQSWRSPVGRSDATSGGSPRASCDPCPSRRLTASKRCRG